VPMTSEATNQLTQVKQLTSKYNRACTSILMWGCYILM
jgi:hypothetical protein